MPLVEIKGYNVRFYFWGGHLIKRKQELYEKIVEMSRNNDDTTANLADLLYQQNCYKLIDTEYQDKQIQTLFNKLIS